MSKPVVFMFAGQGSQSFHMGRRLFERVPEFRARLEQFDAQARAALGHSVLEVVFDPARGRFDPFDRLLHTSPALFMIQYALAETLMQRGLRPDYLFGASLGEFVALAVAEVLPPEEIFSLVIEMSRQLEHKATDGGMMAVLAPMAIAAQCPALFAEVEVAGMTSPDHFIAAGPAHRLRAIADVLNASDAACLVLPVHIAFHSSHVDPMRSILVPLFRDRAWRPPVIPIVSAVTADLLHAVTDEHLWNIMRQPMRLADVFAGLEGLHESLFVDLSPSGTMATVAKYNLDPRFKSETAAVMSPFGDEVDGFEALCERLGVPA